MKYINQRRYPHIPYPTNVAAVDDPRGKDGSVRTSGCGLCSACMVVDQLTTEELSLRECLQMSLDSGANHAPGTDMKILGPLVAEKYDLDYATTDDVQAAAAALQEGARVIVNVGGDREGYKAVFCAGGHYMALISAKDGEFCILDPYWTKNWYKPHVESGLVRMDGYFLYTPYEVLDKDASNRSPRYYIFKRK